MCAQRVLNPDDIGVGSLELIGDKGVASPERLIWESNCEGIDSIGMLMGCEKQLTVDRESFRNHTMARIAGRKPELVKLVMENSSEGIVKDSKILYSVKLFMDFDSQEPGTISLRQRNINLVTGKPFRIKTCCTFQILINSLREDTEYLLDLGANGMGQSNRTLPVVWLGRVNRCPYPRIKCIKYRNLNQVTRAEIYLLLKMEGFVEKSNVASEVTVLDLWKWYFRRSLMMSYPNSQTGSHNGQRRERTPFTIREACLKESCRLSRCRENGFIEQRWCDGQVCPDVGQESHGTLSFQTARECICVFHTKRTREAEGRLW
ncbi:uncharacterized protein TNCV_131731 [Trichonephila clavipes]|nr:uncharacterized protein TNCV_131731 [Trichonephila clavipes]